MGMIQEGEFTIKYHGNQAHVYDLLVNKNFVGKETKDRIESLIDALSMMEAYRKNTKEE